MKDSYYINNWLLDLTAGIIIHQKTGEKKRLGEYQLKLLDVFLEHIGEVLSREELTALVWENRVIGNNSLPNAIHALRMALEDDGKQQKIIKTIPKKGYILDINYCQKTHPTETIQNNDNTHEPELTNDNEVNTKIFNAYDISSNNERVKRAALLPFHEKNQIRKEKNSLVLPNKRSLFWPIITFIILLVFVLTTMYLITKNKETHPSLSLVDHTIEVYNNIQITEIMLSPVVGEREDELFPTIKNTLYILNGELEKRHIYLKLYYHLNALSLNMTFLFKNRCQQQQSIVNITHWRTNKSKLNNIIYDEIENTINTIPVCTY